MKRIIHCTCIDLVLMKNQTFKPYLIAGLKSPIKELLYKEGTGLSHQCSLFFLFGKWLFPKLPMMFTRGLTIPNSLPTKPYLHIKDKKRKRKWIFSVKDGSRELYSKNKEVICRIHWTRKGIWKSGLECIARGTENLWCTRKAAICNKIAIKNSKACMKVEGRFTECFEIGLGVRRLCGHAGFSKYIWMGLWERCKQEQEEKEQSLSWTERLGYWWMTYLWMIWYCKQSKEKVLHSM